MGEDEKAFEDSFAGEVMVDEVSFATFDDISTHGGIALDHLGPEGGGVSDANTNSGRFDSTAFPEPYGPPAPTGSMSSMGSNMFTSVQGGDMFSSMVAAPPPMTSNNGSYRIPSEEGGGQHSGNVFLSVNPAFSSGGSGGQTFSSVTPAFGAGTGPGSSGSSPAASPFNSVVVSPNLPPPPPQITPESQLLSAPPPPLTDMDADVMTVNVVGVAPPVAPPPSHPPPQDSSSSG